MTLTIKDTQTRKLFVLRNVIGRKGEKYCSHNTDNTVWNETCCTNISRQVNVPQRIEILGDASERTIKKKKRKNKIIYRERNHPLENFELLTPGKKYTERIQKALARLEVD
nr:unnamed protein product [Callosobruchus chinensis]